MKLKLLLLFLLFTSSTLLAQTAYNSLVISEARIDEAHQAYCELTNVGDQTINLSEFEFGRIDPWTEPYRPSEDAYMMLPDHELAPGESFVIAIVYDYTNEQWVHYPEQFNERINKEDIEYLADLQIHPSESAGAASDSVSDSPNVMTVWGGTYCWYLEHHFTADDSAQIDQVNGVFTGQDGYLHGGINDVAGVADASDQTVLVRKFSVKTGTLDFETGRGQDIEESEWIPIPFVLAEWEPFRKSFWTVGNHGDYNLDETTLTSDIITVDYANKKLIVPWGVRNNDSVMMALDYKPGLAWHYHLAPVREDSAYISARTGDSLTIYACGIDLDEETFAIELLPPTADENRVIPKAGLNTDGFYWDDPGPSYEVTDGLAMDTILELPFATRVDSLRKYLEKAPDASWKIIFKDGTERPDLLDGDILRVTSQNGADKDYYIQVEEYLPSHNASLSAITWPDMPENYKGLFGWGGDTIPGFAPSKFNYKFDLPPGVDGIPALVASTQDLNARVVVERATYLFGTVEDRTTTFTVTAEDDTTVNVYKVQVVKKKEASQQQPFTTGEPFISELELRQAWSNTFIEICNPNGIPMDMSNYMVVRAGGDPYEAVVNYTAIEDTTTRYNRYVPGYKWQTPDEWAVTPAVLEQDLSGTNPIVQGGDVFVIGVPLEGHWKEDEVDFNFRNPPFEVELEFTHSDWNTWQEDRSIVSMWYNSSIYLFKILNPDVKAGTVPANNPADFEIIDIWGHGDWTNWVIGGENADQNRGWIRRPQYYYGETVAAVSFGTSDEDCQWDERTEAYYQDLGYGWPTYQEMIADNVGAHFMNDITEHLSTVTSRYYLVSPGYSLDETIDGLVTGITVDEFLSNVVKAQSEQTINVMSGTTNGVELTGTDQLSAQDTLIVVSANGNETTKYVLLVDGTGLSDNAVLTSTEYTVDQTGDQGTVSGFDYGTLLSAVINNVTVPEGASMQVIDSDGAYVPLKILNNDSLYVEVLATDDVYFEVVAQDGLTKITYQLTPNSAATDAFVLSYLYLVVEEDHMIRYIPGGTTVSSLLGNLIPAVGASMKVFDKDGFERTSGNIYKDDVVVVTAQDGTTEATYTFEMLEDLVFYQAYVTSDVYVVNSETMLISGGASINDRLTVSDFLANLESAPGAAVTVVDANMDAKDDADWLVSGDQVMVVSANGATTVYYDITVQPSSRATILNREINVYPNPTRGMINVDGLISGDRIEVYNVLGVKVMEQEVYTNRSVIYLDDRGKGIYFLVISDKQAVRDHFRVIVE